jgi:hypothetical protein
MSGNDARIRIKVAGYQRFSDLISNNIVSKWNKLANKPQDIPWEVFGGHCRNVSFRSMAKDICWITCTAA